MEPPEPNSLVPGYALVFVSAVVALTASTISNIPQSRIAALLERSEGFPRTALARYAGRDTFIQSRWRALRALGVAAATLLLLPTINNPVLTLAAVIVPYVVLSQLGAALLRGWAEAAAPTLLTVLRPLEWLVAPLCDPVVLLTRLLARPLKHSIPSPQLAETEVELVVTQGEQSGALGHEQSEMIRNVLEFGDTQARDLMVPRPQINAIELGTSPERLLELILKEGHSRYPVYRDSIDNIVGVLHVKDLFLFTATHPIESMRLKELLRHAVYVPETQRAASVLQQLRAGRHHMAIVLDEFGGVAGVLTLEDLLEEIVGEIRDEHDREEDDSLVVELSRDHFVVDASIPIAELNRQLGTALPDDQEYNSLGGYIIDAMGRVPPVGAVLEREGHRFLVQAADERRITTVEITRSAPLRVSA
ncbi:MAG TPA: hemolysin family protein [Polyangiaceae bacterium]|nr:hemolysin family protein [Polyangiaceae bacterium]